MTKKFTQSIVFVLLLNLMVKPVWIFAIDRTIQNRVGAEQYGMYFSLFSFSLLFNIIADLGITNFNIRNIARDHSRLNVQIGNLITLRLMLGALYVVSALLIAYFIGYTKREFQLLLGLIINQMIVSFTLYLRSNISGLQLFNTDSLISVIDKMLLIVICGLLLWKNNTGSFEIEWFIYAQSISYSVTFLIALFVVFQNTGKIKIKPDFRASSEILKKSLPFAILMFLMMVYTRIDVVMLERLLPDGKFQAGIYAQAYRIIDALSMLAYLFAGILFPLFAKMIKDHKPLKEIIGHSSGMLIIPSIGIIAALLFYSKNIIKLLYHHHVEESSTILQILVIGYFGMCMSYIYGTLLTAAGNLKILNRIALSGFIINIILNSIMIPHFKAHGAAASSMFTQLAMGILQLVLSKKIFKIQIDYYSLFKYFLLVIAVLGSGLFTKSLSVNWIYAIMIIPLITLIIGFALKLLRKEYFTSFITIK